MLFLSLYSNGSSELQIKIRNFGLHAELKLVVGAVFRNIKEWVLPKNQLTKCETMGYQLTLQRFFAFHKTLLVLRRSQRD